jgi:hypothetical protein
MNGHTDPQIIYDSDGKPLYALIPFEKDLQKATKASTENDIRRKHGHTFPLEVCKAVDLHDKSPLQAWREYKSVSTTVMAVRLSMSEDAYLRLERLDEYAPDVIERLALALDIHPEQLDM